MKKLVATIGLMITLAISIYAGQIYGSLTEDGRSVPAKVKFDVICKEQVFGGETDSYGAYSVNVGRGKCTFKVYYKNQTPTFDLYSSGTPLRYDFDLTRQPNGVYLLRRK